MIYWKFSYFYTFRVLYGIMKKTHSIESSYDQLSI
jgi:hypothetical protein